MNLDHFIAQHVRPSKHKCFYHFTDKRNLPSIRQHGLLSTARLRRGNIEIPAPGGNEWSLEADEASGMDAYVHLCFIDSHPMEYCAKKDGRIDEVIYLRIQPEVLEFPGTMITNDVSNKSGIVPGIATAMLDDIDLEVIYTRTDWSNPDINARLQAARKYEILITDQIPTKYIVNLGDG